MKLLKAEIFGFGKWQNQTISFEEEGLTVIYGENEAGKSTLHAFILYILFDLPPRKWKSYEPITGGSIGGRLHISLPEQGEVVIERVANKQNGEARCFAQNGEESGENELKQLLHGIDRNTYESIFSFGLKSLQDIQSLQEEDLGNVLFGIGMTGSKQIYETEKQLEKQLDQRFKKRGRNPEINQQLHKVKQLEKEMHRLKEDEQKYQSYRNEEQRLEEAVHHMQEERLNVNQNLSSVERLLQALEPIQRFQDAERQLSQYETPISFPEDGLERYYHLKDQVLPLQSEQNVLISARERDKQKVENIPKYELNEINLAKSLTDQAEWYEVQNEQCLQLKSEVDEEKRRIQQSIQDLGLGLDMNDLEELHLPFYIQELWENLVEEQKQLQLDLEHNSNQLNALHEQKEQIHLTIQQLKQTTLFEDIYQDYKDKVEDHKEQQLKQKIAHQQKEEKKQKEAQFEEQQKQRKKSIQRFLLIASVLFLTGIIVSVVLDNMWIAAIATLFMIFISTGVHMLGKSAPIHQDHILHVSEQGDGWNEEEIQTFQHELNRHEETEKELDRQNQILQQIKRDEIQHEEWLRTLEQRKSRLNERIQDQLGQFDFLKKIALEYWPKTYQRLYQIQQDLKEWNSRKYKCEEQLDRYRSFEEEVLSAGSKLGIHGKREMSAILGELKDYLNRYEKHEEQRQHLLQNIEFTREQEEALNQKIQPIQQEMNQLFEIAQVEDEESFVRKGNKYNQVLSLELIRDEAKRQVTATIRDETRIQEVLSETLDESQLTNQRDQMYKDLDELNKKIEDHRQKWSDVKSMLTHLEENESYSTIRHQLMLEKNRLREQAKEWAVYQVAYQSLQKTKAYFQQERMPLVIEYCQHFFNILTKEAYNRIFPPQQNQTFVVESKDGYQYEASDLSQGTKEQLYVSLRLALSRVISEDHPLPFIIDDAFVNFDPKRKQEMVQLLGEISTSQQVLYLTCPPEEAFSEDRTKNLYKKISFYLP